MELNTIEITLTDADLRAMVTKYAGSDDIPVSDLDARIDTSGVVISGEFKAAFLKGSFEAIVSLTTSGQTVIATLAELKALGPVGNMFKGLAVSMLQEKLADIPGISGDGETIKFDLPQLLAQRGLEARIDSLDISFAAGRLAVSLSGSLEQAE
ncbi:MAG: hypothetical protein GY794_12860 [bacterium]|nr:hypothetical protein [bacterium]